MKTYGVATIVGGVTKAVECFATFDAAAAVWANAPKTGAKFALLAFNAAGALVGNFGTHEGTMVPAMATNAAPIAPAPAGIKARRIAR